MKAAGFLALCWLCIGILGVAAAQSPYDKRTTAGPDRGWLIIQGGGNLTPEVRDRFIALAGGPIASIVAIPTALADNEFNPNQYAAALARALGVPQVSVLHTRDRSLANSPALVEPLKHATGVWLEGGRQWRLADAYLGTAVEREIKALLERGGVVLGSSAGATIQGSFLVRGASATPENPAGDNTIMVSPGHVTGFGLLADAAIDQHVDARSREADLDPVIAAHPHLLGIGLYQDAAIIVHADSFFVVGAPVLIHDGRRYGSTLYYTLSPGDVYDLKKRAAAQVLTAAQAQQYPLSLILDAVTERTSEAGGTRTNGTGVLQARGTVHAAQQAARPVSVVCDTGLYAIGAVPLPARLDGASYITILSRGLGGDELRSSKCRLADAGSKPDAQAISAARNAAPGEPNMNCGEAYSPGWDNCVGLATYSNGNVYRGEFHHGMREGFGVLVINATGVSDQNNILSNEPAVYAGEFRGNRLNGHGVWVTQSGIASAGTYRDNIAQPDVAQRNCSGPRSALWSHCVAVVSFDNGNVYRGEFVNGNREGIGMIEINAIGTSDATGIRARVPGVYVGEFKGDLINGRGMIFMPGAGFYGAFVNNVLAAQSH